MWPEKTADISRRYHWFPREMTSEKRAQKFHDLALRVLSCPSLRSEREREPGNEVLMTPYYSDLGGAFDWFPR